MAFKAKSRQNIHMEPINFDVVIHGGFILFVLKEVWQSMKGRGKEHDIALKHNTEALIELRSEMKYIGMYMHEISERVKKLEANG